MRPTLGLDQPPLDLERLVDRAHFAFRVRDGASQVEHPSFRAELREDELVFTARREADESRPAASERLTVRTKRVARGGTHLATTRARPAIDAGGDIALDRGGVVEHFHADADGVEQSWSFAVEPDGEGDLDVDVDVDGLDYVTTTATGLHFRGASGLGVCYGHATFVDAGGRRTDVPVALVQGALRMRVPADVLETASYPAVLDPTVGPEIAVDTPVAVAAAPGATDPAVAFGASTYLVTWTDGAGAARNILGARVSAAGQLLDATGILVSGAALDQSSARVAFDGTNFVVVWSDSRSNMAADIYAARITPAGAVLDTNGIRVSSPQSTGEAHPSIAVGNGSSLIVWDDARNASTDVYGARLATDGTVLDPTGVAMVIDPNANTYPRLAYDGAGFLVAYLDRSSFDRVAYQSLDSVGAPIAGAGSVLPAGTVDDGAPVVAWNGASYTIAWDRSLSGQRDIVRTRITAAGVLLDAAPVSTVTTTGDQFATSLVSDGSGSLLSYSDASGIARAIRIDAAELTSPTDGFPLAVVASKAGAAVWNGANYFAVYLRTTSGSDVFGTRIDATNALLDAPPIAISHSWNTTNSVSVATDGTRFLVAWTDARNAGDIYAARVGVDGVVVDPAGIVVDGTGTAASVQRVAYDGTNFQVYALVGSAPAAYRVTPAGATLDLGAPLALGSGDAIGYFGTNAFASSDAGSLAAFGVLANAPFPVFFKYELRVRTVSKTKSTGSYVVVAAETNPDPALATDGTNFLLVYHSNGDVRGQRISAAGALIGSTFVISAQPDYQADPEVSFSNGNYFVAWADHRGGVLSELYGARVTPAGVVLEPGGVPIAGGNSGFDRYAPSMAPHDGGWVITWKDFRNTGDDVYAARIDANLGSLDGGGFLVQSRSDGYGQSHVAVAGARAFVAYRHAAPVLGETYHAYGRMICLGTNDTTCDGVDDDCDGTPDEDYVPIGSTCGTGVCARTGTVTCSAGVPSDSCVVGTATGADADCDAVDQDCDGTADDGFPVVQTSCGLGVCTASGLTTCVGGVTGDTCVPGAATGTDSNCNGTDEDCDGFADDGYVTIPSICGSGTCTSAGRTVCTTAAVSIVCDAPPVSGPDTNCDGVDDDCDGTPDDGYVPSASACGLGACAAVGTKTCLAGTELDSCEVGVQTGGDANCNGIDEDCDGLADDGFAAVTTSCGVGACAATGATSCVAGAVLDSCAAGAPLGPDTTCDGIDDDCSGVADQNACVDAGSVPPDGGPVPDEAAHAGGCGCVIAGSANPSTATPIAFIALGLVLAVWRARRRSRGCGGGRD